MSRRRLAAALFALTAFAALAGPAWAEDDAFEFYKEEADVVTVSRRPEPAWRAPAAVDVVTAEDIKAYGWRTVWDALRWRAGMDVVEGRSLDGNRALVSARGFTQEFVSEMQVLVDGRSVYSPLLGGVYWQSLPVQMQDIERIEIVRGPNAALYGSNAALGVINIITRRPRKRPEGAAAARAGDRSAGAEERAEAGGDAGALRVSHSFEQEEGHPRADGTGDADDFLRANKLNVRALWTPDSRTDFDLQTGGVWLTAGLPGLSADPRARHRDAFASIRATRRLEGGSSVEAELSHDNTWIGVNPLFLGNVQTRIYQYDAELLHRFSWAGDRALTTWGAEWRLSGAYSDQVFAGRPAQSSRLARAYMDHSVRVAEPLTLVAGLSVERSDTGGTQPAGQAALLWSPSDEHAVRLSYSLAPTLPSLFDHAGDYRLSATERALGNPGDQPEKLTSWDLGWSARLLDGALKPALSLYEMTIRERAFNYVSGISGGVASISGDGRDRAEARGLEASVEYLLGAGGAAFANYTYEVIANDKGADAYGIEPARNSPRHKANLGARAPLGRGVTAAAAVGFKDDYDAASTSRALAVHVPSSWRLDVRVAWSPRPAWEVFAAAQSLLQPYRVEYADGTVVPREYEVGVQARFGP